ncbi:hypothetical protein IW492_03420 [Enterococcus sp. BWB1-3]|uniref:hypothetical protein n=1 Tax=Enterococcus sp. BWB1-3 TaxID=2787713 RepID=UPI00192512D6|nr:hypothetical protein [Enterococcus sp. BWB1-3]MBL1228282.1 hypothetical protein [Enterococcus sp. BWB1-3]
MKRNILFITFIVNLLLISACSNITSKNSAIKKSVNESEFFGEEASSTSNEIVSIEEKENQRKIQHLEVYNEILTKYNNQTSTMYKLSELPLSNVTLHKSNIRLATVQFGKTDTIIVGFNEIGIQAILLKNTADLEYVESSLSSLLDNEITIRDGEIIGTSKFVKGEDYPNNTSEYYIPIVTDEINYYPEKTNENWKNDFLEVTTESSINDITDDE